MRKIHQTALLIFIEVFPVLVIGVKTNKNVFVRSGDNIVLNCTCFRENNGNWKGPNMSSLSNHLKEEYLIPYATGLKLNPILNRSNVHIVGDYDRSTCKLVIDDFSALNEGIYKCQYIKTNITHNHVFKVLVIYPPDLTLHLYKSSVGIKLTCNVSAVPSIYKFEDWEHCSKLNQHIRYLKGTHDGNLFIQDNQYQNSGIYTCKVTNGVSLRNGNLFQTQQISIPYGGPPIFVFGNNQTYYGQYGKEINVAFNIFSSSEIRVTLIKTNCIQTFKALVTPHYSTCKGHLEFYGVNITVLCTRLTFSFLLSGTDQFANYTADICNKHGCNNRVIEIVSDKNDLPSTYVYGYCWIIMGSIVGGVVFSSVCSHIYYCLKRAKTMRTFQNTNPDDDYDEVETLNYNNAMSDHIANDEELNHDNESSMIESNDTISRNDVVNSDDSSSIKLSSDGYENPYQATNPCNIEIHHYSSIASCNYQNTIIFPPSLSTNTAKKINIAIDSLKNPWLVIYKSNDKRHDFTVKPILIYQTLKHV